MWQQIGLIGLFGLLWGVGLWLASRWGSKKAQIDALKEEIKRHYKEQATKNEIDARVDNMSDDDARKRLQQTKRN